jgi:uncharacterized protein (TIGR00369 family)
MAKTYKHCSESEVILSQLMQPSHSNFGGKIHGGFILNLMDQVAFACAAKHAGNYCVTASVEKVNFLAPIEVGELVTMKAAVNYVGRTSMVVGIRVEAENFIEGVVKHSNSSFFTMVAKKDNKPVEVPGLILRAQEEARRFLRSTERLKNDKARKNVFSTNQDFPLEDYKHILDGKKVQIDF